MKIWVAACSMIALADPALERILRALRRKTDNAIALADGLLPVLDPAHEDLVVQRLPALIDNDDRRRAIEPFLDAVEEIEQGRRACLGSSRMRGHVEPDGLSGQVRPVLLIVEQPGPAPRCPTSV